MLQAMNKISASMQQTVQSIEAALDPSKDEEYVDRLTAYKQLLVESQFEHLKVFRSLQQLIGEKESQIHKLVKRNSQDDEAETNEENEPAASNDAEALPKVDAEDLDTWQKQIIKRNIEEKLDAIAEARIQTETVHALQRQLKMLKDHIREQDAEMEKLKELVKKTQSGSEDAMENLAMEYSKLNGEIEEYREQLVLLRQENKELRERKLEEGEVKQDNAEELNSKVEELTGALLSKEQELDSLRNDMELAKASREASIKDGQAQLKALSAEMTSKIEALEGDISKLAQEKEQQLSALQQELRTAEETSETLAADLSETKAALVKSSQVAQESETALTSKLTEEVARRTEAEAKAQAAREEVSGLSEELKTLRSTLQEMDVRNENMKKELKDVENRAETKALKLEELLNEASQALMKVHIEAKEERERALEDQRRALINKYEEALELYQKECEEKVNMAENKVEDFKGLYAKESNLRKKVHNDLMDLKGNIRVYCRVRPLNEQELKQENTDVIEYPLEKEMIVHKDKTNSSRFEFDSVFGPECSQVQVFQDIEGLIMSALDGYNVCIFAYGQTGSGKTYTMEGTPENPGVNCRALQKLFEMADKKSDEMEMTFSVSVLEIYNETVKDLLSSTRNNLDLRLNGEGKVYVENLQKLPCDSMDEVLTVMSRASKNRSTGSHNMNEHSSRSHLVVTISADTKNLVNGVRTNGSLCLIDLAGSERVGKTDATGERLKEAQNINKSLSALGDVIAALGERKKKKGHIPYRNSKLTFLLQNSLGGDSKVAMFVNISPADYNVTESLCSLNFATRCRKVQLGQAKKNSDNVEVAKYRKIIEELQQQLKHMQHPGSQGSQSQSPPRSSRASRR